MTSAPAAPRVDPPLRHRAGDVLIEARDRHERDRRLYDGSRRQAEQIRQLAREDSDA